MTAARGRSQNGRLLADPHALAQRPAVPWIERKVEQDAHVLYLAGVWRLPNLVAISHALRALRLRGDGRFVVDGSALQAIDTAAGFTLLRHLADIGCTPETVSARGFDPRHGRLLALVHERMRVAPSAARSRHLGLVPGIGAA